MGSRVTATKRDEASEQPPAKAKTKPMAVPRPGRIGEDGFDRLIYERCGLAS